MSSARRNYAKHKQRQRQDRMLKYIRFMDEARTLAVTLAEAVKADDPQEANRLAEAAIEKWGEKYSAASPSARWERHMRSLGLLGASDDAE